MPEATILLTMINGLDLVSIVNNVASSFLWDGGKWVSKPILDKIPDLATLFATGGSDQNHDLLRALRRAECRTMVSLCDLTLREDFDVVPDSFKSRFSSWGRDRPTPEVTALCHIRRAFAQRYEALADMKVEKLVELYGVPVSEVPALIQAGRECFAATSPDQLRENIVRRQVTALDADVRSLLGAAGASNAELRRLALAGDGGLPASLQTRLEQHSQGWWDLLRLAFREELKDNERAWRAWEMDVLSLLPQQLGHTYPEFEAKLAHLDAQLTGMWDDLKSLRRAFDTVITEFLEDIRDTTHQIDKKVDDIQRDLAEIKARETQRVQAPPFDLPNPALAGKLFGREALVTELVTRLKRRENVDMWGPAGMGKTAVAAAAIRQVVGDDRDKLAHTPYPDGVVLLDLYRLKFTSPDLAWNSLANAFDESLPTTLTARERAERACRGRRALVVVEGAEEAGDGASLQNLLQVLTSETTRLVLTRNKDQANPTKRLTVATELTQEESLALLRELCPAVTDDSILALIHQRLGGHPLALTWAGSQLQLVVEEESPWSFVTALTAEHLPTLNEPGYETHTLPWLYNRSVARLTPEARRVLTAAGLLAYQPLPLSAAEAVLAGEESDSGPPLSQRGDRGDFAGNREAKARTALKSLVRYGLLRFNSGEEEHWEFTHALTHQFANTADVLASLQFKLLYDGLDQINRLGRLDFARTASGAVYEWLQRALTLRPDDTALQRELSVSHIKVGDVLVAQGQLGAALAAYTASRTIAERLAAQDAQNAQWQRDLSVSHMKLGDTLARQNQRAEALANFTQARAISARLVQHDPSHAVWKNDLAWVERRIAELNRTTRHWYAG